MQKIILSFFILFLSIIFILNTHKPIIRQSLSLSCWCIWGLDDISTHYISDSSINILFNLKILLFDLYKSLDLYNYQDPIKVRAFLPKEYSFNLVYDSFIEPLVFPGLFKNSTAIQKWNNIDYLNKTIGNVSCPVVLTNANHFEIQRKSIKYHEILNILKNDTKSSIYVSGDQFIFLSESGEILLNDLDIKKYLGYDFMNSSLYSQDELYLFLGNKGKSGTSWHCAPNRSMFVQIVGRKRWTFIHPKYSLLLHPQRSHLYSRIFLAGESFHYFKNNEEKNKGKNTTIQYDANIFNHIPRMQVILEPGDAVTVPSWYWHHVENLPINNKENEDNIIIGVDIDTNDWNHSWLYAIFPYDL